MTPTGIDDTDHGPHDPAAQGAPTLTHLGPPPGSTQVQDSDDSAAARRRSHPAGPRTVPGYEIASLLGRGGMGVVYLARQTQLNRTVALKMILGGDHADASELVRFVAEGEALATLSHPNIVQVYQAGAADGLPFLALEYVPGGSLEARVRHAPLEPAEAARLIEAVARGVEYAHSRGIVHRDLKPDNVLLADDGTPKIVDFGLAKRFQAGPGLTRTGAVVGTLSYMAPEQARGEGTAVGPAADVYGLGAILYRVLTGRPPFQAATGVLTVGQLLKDEPVPPRALQPAVPRDLDTITLKCLQKDPARRYASAGELADDLDRFLSGEPIRAHPVGPLEKVWRWCRKNPRVAGLAAALAVVLVGGLAGMTALWQRAVEREAAADQSRQDAERSEQGAQEAAESARAAAARARAEEARARAEEKKAQATADFLAGLFEAADPLQVSGAIALVPRDRAEQLTARQMLDRGARQIEKRTDLDPDTRGLLVHRIGSSLLALGEVDRARPLLAEARNVLEQKYGPDHPALAGTRHSLAWLEHLRGNYALAREHYDKALALQRAKPPGPEAEHGLSAIQLQYAILLADLDEEDAALALTREALGTRQRLHPADDPRVAEAHFGCAIVALEAGDAPTALKHARAGMAIFQTQAPGDPLAKAMGLFQQGVVEAQARDGKAAGLGKIREAVDLTEKSLGRLNQYTLLTKAQLGLEELSARQYARAEATLEACFETARELRVLTHPKAAVLVQKLGEALARQNKPDRARVVVAEWLKAHEDLNADSLPHADALTVAAEVAGRLGDRDEERRRLEAARAIYQRQPAGFKRYWYVNSLEALGRSYVRAGRWADAEAAYRDCLAVLRARYTGKLDADEWAVPVAGLARAVFRQGRYPAEVGQELTEVLGRDPDGRGWVQATVRLAEYRRYHGARDEALTLLRAAADRAKDGDDLFDTAEQLALSAAAADPKARKGLFDQAANTLARAVQAGYRDADAVAASGAFKPLAGHPTFDAVLAQMRERR